MRLEGGSFRPYADNVLIVLEPEPTESKGGIALVPGKTDARGTRTAKVVASGPGYMTKLGAFIENQVKPGDRVLVGALAGEDWSWNFSAPRHNPKGAEWKEVLGQRGEFRAVREQEILAVLE